MENHVHSALICASRLIRLAGLNPMDIETFSQKVAIDTSVKNNASVSSALYRSIFTNSFCPF